MIKTAPRKIASPHRPDEKKMLNGEEKGKREASERGRHTERKMILFVLPKKKENVLNQAQTVIRTVMFLSMKMKTKKLKGARKKPMIT